VENGSFAGSIDARFLSFVGEYEITVALRDRFPEALAETREALKLRFLDGLDSESSAGFNGTLVVVK
jgi:hypothetical protein